MRRILTFVAIFCMGVLIGAIFFGAVAQARNTPTTAFKNTPELLGVIANQNYETQNLLDKVIDLEDKQLYQVKEIAKLSKDQLNVQKEMKRLMEDMKRLEEDMKRIMERR